MNPTIKKVLENIAKNAINASLTALGPVAFWQSQFNFHDWSSIKHILGVMGSAALAREIMVYGPKIMSWSQSTNGNGDH